MTDLNKIGLRVNCSDDKSQVDYGCDVGKIRVYFRGLTAGLTRHIRDADVVVGNVAWLTSEEILRVMAKLNGVSIVVQKEDFLRPDVDDGGTAARVRPLYEALRGLEQTYFKDGPIGQIHGVAMIDAVRCVGEYGSRKAIPRAHNKFVVFCRKNKPYAVWTGSFNFTRNAERSFENAVYIEDEQIALAYFNEFQQIACLSEPLDWEQEWVSPEWRTGQPCAHCQAMSGE